MLLRMICTDETLVNGPGYLVAGESYRIGRSSSCAFVVGDLSVSRYHAEVTARDAIVLVKDMGSRNGTFVDGVRVEQQAEVQPGQVVRFGSARFQLVSHEHAEESDHENSALSTLKINDVPPPQHPAVLQLSDAQKRVLDLLLDGKSEKEVARRLEISPHTVHNHVKEIYKKMEVNSRPELLALFVPESQKAGKKGK
jgi:pSer/pThr/pTyr-binding forkhead associated (FHA) protein